jgi:hypothetical protein
MSSLPPFVELAAATGAAGIEPLVGACATMAFGPGRVLAGGGTWLATFCVALGALDGDTGGGG